MIVMVSEPQGSLRRHAFTGVGTVRSAHGGRVAVVSPCSCRSESMSATSSWPAIVRSARSARYAASLRPPASSAPSSVARSRSGCRRPIAAAASCSPTQPLATSCTRSGASRSPRSRAERNARSTGESGRTTRPCPLGAGRPRPLGRPLLFGLMRPTVVTALSVWRLHWTHLHAARVFGLPVLG